MSISVSILSWNDARLQAQEIRRKVFIEEQQIPESVEVDEEGDSAALHAIAFDGETHVVGTGRMFSDGRVGRMAVLSSHRSKGVGAAILKAFINRAKNDKVKFLCLGAQIPAESFYLRNGFVRIGELYMHPLFPIEHVDMMLPLTDIYLDFNSTTPLCESAIEAMTGSLRAAWGNPGSVGSLGSVGKSQIEGCKSSIASLIDCDPSNLIITSGGTEANNTALRSVLEGKDAVVVTSPFEHPAIDEVFKGLPRVRVIRIPVDRHGMLNEEDFVSALKTHKVDLVTIMFANNEMGAVNDIARLVELTRKHSPGTLFHSDAAQAVGKVLVRVGDIDFMTLVAHKFYGPKAVGVLYSRVPVVPLLRGGSQQGGRRAGTESALLCTGMRAAADFARDNLGNDNMRKMRDLLWTEIQKRFKRAERWNNDKSLPNTLSVCLDPEGPLANDIVYAASKHNVYFSAGAACHSGVVHPSQTLLSIGVHPDKAVRTLRFSTGHSTCEQDITFAIYVLSKIILKS